MLESFQHNGGDFAPVYRDKFEPYILNKLHNERLETPLQYIMTWWRHQMKTFSALLAICAVPGPRWIPRTKASGAEL